MKQEYKVTSQELIDMGEMSENKISFPPRIIRDGIEYPLYDYRGNTAVYRLSDYELKLRNRNMELEAENAKMKEAIEGVLYLTNQDVEDGLRIDIPKLVAYRLRLKDALKTEQSPTAQAASEVPAALDKPKFKVGDKVRVKNSYTSYHGMIGEVEDVNVWRNRREYGVRFETVKGVRELLEAELELYTETAVQS